MPHSLQEFVKEADDLVSFPEVVSQFNEAINNGRSDAFELGIIIQQDPALTAKLLQIANSAFYGALAPAHTVDDAIVRIGTKQVRDLVFCICAKNAFDGIPVDLITPEDFWKHSLLCAVSARVLSRNARLLPVETLFTAGLLHDIGHLVLFSLEPEQSIQALQLNIDEYDGLDSSQSEQSIFGFDHAQVGKELAHQWNLPDLIQECIAFHHKPTALLPNSRLVAGLHVANTIATLAELQTNDLSQGPIVCDVAWSLLGTDESIIEPCIPLVIKEYTEMAKILFGDAQEAA